MTLNSKKPVAKKRGRPLGVKNKRKVVKKISSKAPAFKQQNIDELLDTIECLELEIKNLEHKATQYAVVINYLETKLEIW